MNGPSLQILTTIIYHVILSLYNSLIHVLHPWYIITYSLILAFIFYTLIKCIITTTFQSLAILSTLSLQGYVPFLLKCLTRHFVHRWRFAVTYLLWCRKSVHQSHPLYLIVIHFHFSLYLSIKLNSSLAFDRLFHLMALRNIISTTFWYNFF